MSYSVRGLLYDLTIWLSVFFVALAAFFYLDDRIGAFTANDRRGTAEQKIGPDNSAAPLVRPSRQEENGNGRVTLQAGSSGHFEVRAYINDSSIKLLADTGATYVVLTFEDAEELDLTDNLNFTGRAHTANGVSRIAPITLDTVEVGDISVSNVKAFVAEKGKLSTSLLGMSFIGRLSSFQMSGRELILEQ